MILGLTILFGSTAVVLPLIYYLDSHAPLRSDRAWKEELVRVRDAFDPDTVTARVGQPLRISFALVDDRAAGERVEIPDFRWSAALLPSQEVSVDVLPDRAGTYRLHCGTREGRLIVVP
jgi:plastocyanin domain-containing protein